MKKIFINILKFLLFFALSIFLLWLIFRKQDFDELIRILREDINYFWIFLAIAVGLVSHISRAVRWNMLIEALGKKSRFSNSFLTIMVGYFANLALPRMGEVTRCGLLSRYENISFSKLVGTVVTERALDVLMLIFSLILAVITQFGVLKEFWFNHPEISENLSKIFSSFPFIIGFIILMVLLWIYRKKFSHSVIYQKFRSFVKDIIAGIKSIKHVKNKAWFIFHCIFIWFLYFLMMYLCFFAFEFTSGLSLLAALALFVLGSLGMVAPVQGGIGAFHIMIIGGLLVYLPDAANIDNLSRSFALVVHGIQTLMFIVVGAVALVLLPVVNKKQN